MGMIQKIFGRRPARPAADGYFKSFTAYTPAFRTWDGQLYESELVRAAVDAKARHISKLRIELRGSAKPRMQTQLRSAPNEFQTWSQFLYRLSTILDMQNTAFIVPVLNEYGDTCGVFPLVPSTCEVVNVHGEPWLRYAFASGDKASMELSRCGVMVKHQYKDDYFGEKNSALRNTMSLMTVYSQGIEEATKNSNTFRFMAQVNNFLSPDDLKKERQRFTSENLRSDGEGGLLLFPNTYKDIRQIQNNSYTIDTAQVELIQKNVYRYFGVSEQVLDNTADETLLDAFFNGCIEPFSIQLSEVLDGMLFSKQERGFGNHVVVSSNRLAYMSTSNKVAMARDLGDRGILTVNEIRELFNYLPLPDGQGDFVPIRGEYYDLTKGRPDREEDVEPVKETQPADGKDGVKNAGQE